MGRRQMREERREKREEKRENREERREKREERREKRKEKREKRKEKREKRRASQNDRDASRFCSVVGAGNGIGVAGCEALLAALRENTAVTALDVGGAASLLLLMSSSLFSLLPQPLCAKQSLLLALPLLLYHSRIRCR
jgi:hypothetical protein